MTRLSKIAKVVPLGPLQLFLLLHFIAIMFIFCTCAQHYISTGVKTQSNILFRWQTRPKLTLSRYLSLGEQMQCWGPHWGKHLMGQMCHAGLYWDKFLWPLWNFAWLKANTYLGIWLLHLICFQEGVMVQIMTRLMWLISHLNLHKEQRCTSEISHAFKWFGEVKENLKWEQDFAHSVFFLILLPVQRTFLLLSWHS